MIEPLGSPPRSSAAHLWADYWELLCLRNLDGEFSRSDLEEWVVDCSVEGENATAIKEGETYDFAQHLAFRAEVFGTWYPFTLGGADILQVAAEWTERRRLYVFLLMATNLRYFKPGQPTLTRQFELTSRECLQRMFRAEAPVHVFGASHNDHYTGSLWTRISQLADDLCETVTAREANFPPQNQGDGGLDLVGWVPPGDQESGRITVFAQCACGVDWEMKQYSSCVDHWGNRITFRANPVNMLFTPQCFRNANGSWFNDDEIHRTVLVDRLRLTSTLADGQIPDAIGAGNELVDQLLANPDPIY